MWNRSACRTIVSPIQNTPKAFLDYRTPGASRRVTLLAAMAALALCHCAPRTAPQTATGAAPGAVIDAPAAGPAGAAQAALARFKQATGGAAWDAVHTLHVTGTIDPGGLTGSFERFDDLPTGRHNAAAALSLADTRGRWRSAAPGTRVRLRIENAQGKREVAITLRDL